MRWLENALRQFMDTDRRLLEVLGPDGGVERSFSYREVSQAAWALVDRLREAAPWDESASGRPLQVGVVCANTPAFIISDLACLLGRVVEVPVPLAFSRDQAACLLGEVGVCLVDEQGARRLAEWDQGEWVRHHVVLSVDVDVLIAAGVKPPSTPPPDEEWICKIIHTSGTTSRPKGVRIRARGLEALLTSLNQEMPGGAFLRYLCTVPLSLLVEQVTALYMVLLQGGVLVLLPSEVPLVGTAASASARVLPFLAAARPTALVATPSLVNEIRQGVEAARCAGASVCQSLFGTDRLPLICCGGAPVDPQVLRDLDELGILIYEGYGLSENGSVVSWNRPGARRIGTVGRPLPHVQVRLSPQGELFVKSSSLFAGYTINDPSSCVVDEAGWLHTGDLGQIDEEGFIRVTGRIKNVIVTSAGRNIAPEWVESQYATLPFVRCVAVVGNHWPVLHGLFLIDPKQDLDAAREAILALGASQLSEIERVQVAHVMPVCETTYRRFFTVTGRPMRAVIESALRAEEGEVTMA